MADSDAEAREVAARHLLISYRDEYGGGEWRHPLIGAEDSAPIDRFDELSRGRFLVGSPDTVIRDIQDLQLTFGVDHLICRLFFPGLSHEFIMRELHLLADEVMPAFTESGAGPGSEM